MLRHEGVDVADFDGPSCITPQPVSELISSEVTDLTALVGTTTPLRREMAGP